MKLSGLIKHGGLVASLGLAGLIGCGVSSTSEYDNTEEIIADNANIIANELENDGYTVERDVLVVIGDPVMGQPVGLVYDVQGIKGTDWQLYRTSSAMYNILRADRASVYPPEEHPHLGIFSESDTQTTLRAQIDAFEALPNP